MREHILKEIRRLADAANGKAPGKLAFARLTGISEGQWSGILWSRWSDALKEAGCATNTLQARFETRDMLMQVIAACRHYGHVPTIAEMKLYRRQNPKFPSKGAIAGHFQNRAVLLTELHRLAEQEDGLRDIVHMVATSRPGRIELARQAHRDDPEKIVEGHVYLLKSGQYYKIGRSDKIERRIKEVRVALPEAVTLLHAIKTDDPSGIEAYWHRRFADKRANGEWFRLSERDLSALKNVVISNLEGLLNVIGIADRPGQARRPGAGRAPRRCGPAPGRSGRVRQSSTRRAPPGRSFPQLSRRNHGAAGRAGWAIRHPPRTGSRGHRRTRFARLSACQNSSRLSRNCLCA